MRLRRQFLLLLLLPLMLVMAGSSLLFFLHIKQQSMEQGRRHLDAYVARVHQQVWQRVESVGTLLGILRASGQIADYFMYRQVEMLDYAEDARIRVENDFQRISRENADIRRLHLIDSDGLSVVDIAAGRIEYRHRSFQDQAWFQQALAMDAHNWQISSPGGCADEQASWFWLARPVTDRVDRTVGVLAVQILAESLLQGAGTGGAGLPNHDHPISLLDAEGCVLTSEKAELVGDVIPPALRNAGNGIRSIGGEQVMALAMPLGVVEVQVFSTWPMSEIHHQATRFGTFNALLIGAAVLLMVVIVSLVIRGLTNPLSELEREVEGLSGESQTVRLSPQVLAARNEVGGLARAFKRMGVVLADRMNALEESHAELARSRDSLEEQVRQRTTELEQAKDAAETASRSKSVFLANMSHELRTPLNAILGFAQLMQRDPGLTDEQKQELSTINRSGQHLLALINDVLDISRIEAGKLHLEKRPFDLTEALESIAEMVGVRAQNKGLQLELAVAENVPQYVLGDEGKLRQVLVNLLGNAVKYTQEGRVGLSAEAWHDGGRVRIDFRVSDTGRGISPEDQESIFDAFVQSTTEPNLGEGTGLGLTISREYVQLMGGRLELDSTPGQGSEFAFSIETEEADEAQVSGRSGQRQVKGLAPGQPAIRVLIAEDKEDNRLLLRRLLESVGFEVREAHNGEQAIALFEAWHPDLIWMDMRMPVMDGYEATRRIKSTPSGKAAVVVALTASAFEEDRTRVLAVGCDDFVRKPMNANEIFSVMQRHLGLRYVYADDPVSAAKTADLTARDLADLPDALLRDLNKAAVELDPVAAAGAIERIEAVQPGLAEPLRKLVDEFRFKDLMQLCGGE